MHQICHQIISPTLPWNENPTANPQRLELLVWCLVSKVGFNQSRQEKGRPLELFSRVEKQRYTALFSNCQSNRMRYLLMIIAAGSESLRCKDAIESEKLCAKLIALSGHTLNISSPLGWPSMHICRLPSSHVVSSPPGSVKAYFRS